MADPLVRFGLFELDSQAAELRREGIPVPLQELPFRLLCALLERPGQIVTREEVRQRLWPAGVHVDFDNSLNAAMSRLREALGDTATNPRFVATEPKRGWRFIAPVERVVDGSAANAAAATGSAAASRRRLPLVLAALGATVVVVTLGSWARHSLSPPTRRPGKALLAVLPFKDLSGAPDQEYLSDGLTEELISLLGGVSPQNLGVVARSSVMRFKDQPIDRVANELGVRYVLEGTVRREGHSVRVTARLIDAGDQTALWSASFDRKFSEVLPLQADIATRVSRALSGALLGPTREPGRTDAPRASGNHELYLKGRHLLARQTSEAFLKALAAFESAAAEKPEDAAAYRGLADTYLALGTYDVWPTARALPKAAEAARQALDLDPHAADAQLVLAQVRFHDERDWEGAEIILRQVLELNPSLAHAHALYANFLSASARHDEALARMGEARRLDPLSLIVNADLCWTHFLARRYERAVEQCEATLELDPHFLPAHDNLKWILTRMGRAEPAAEAFIRVAALEGDDAESVLSLRRVYAGEGLAGLQRVSLRALLARARLRYQSPYDVALEYAALRERKSALEWLERSFEANETDLILLGVDPRLDPLRGEPRFRELMARVGVPSPTGRPRPAPFRDSPLPP